MLRVVALVLVLFVLPFAVFGIYAYLRRDAGETRPLFDDAPTFWLTATGLAAAIVGIFGFATLERTERDGVYVPAHVENGEIVPGRVVPRDQAGGR